MSDSTSYPTAFSHLVLAGTSIYCLRGVGTQQIGFQQLCFGTIVVNSVLGFWRYGNPSYGDDVAKAYRITQVVQDCFTLPSAATVAYLNYGTRLELSSIHAITGLIPFLSYLNNREFKDALDSVIAGNAISLAIISALNGNYYGIAAAVSYFFAHFSVGNDRNSYFNIPPRDLFNYALCFYAYFAFKTITY